MNVQEEVPQTEHPTSRPMITLKPYKDKAQSKPAGYLDGTFKDYIEACNQAGAIFNPELKCHLLEIQMVPVLVEKLRQQGFNPVLSADLAEIIRTKAIQTRQAVDSAQNRIQAIDQELQKRGLALYEFQKTGVQWLAERHKALLADEMGLGKTIQTLIAIPSQAPVIVVCPASLKGNWQKETKKWRPDLTPRILSRQKNWQWPEPGEMVILNYELLPLLDKTMIPKNTIVLIADEAHAVKNTKSQRTQKFKTLSRMILKHNGIVWLITGTPLLNRAQELWNLLNTADLAQTAFGSFSRFMKLFGAVWTSFGIQWGKPKPELAEILRHVMLSRRRSEVLTDLPAKTWRNIDTAIDQTTLKLCDEFLLQIEQAGYRIEDLIASNPEFEQIAKVRSAVAKAKIPALLDLIKTYEETDEPIVVFSAHRDPIDLLSKRPGWASITGDTTQQRRTEIVEEFQAGRIKGLALTIQAGGVGLTLTRAHECIFVDLMWTPALNKQAEDRLCRIGQTRGVIVNRLIASHKIDQKVMEILNQKQMLIESSIEKAAVGAERQKSLAEQYQNISSVPSVDHPNSREDKRSDEGNRLNDPAIEHEVKLNEKDKKVTVWHG